MKKLFGFTLSEVLIAMVILGIVAALTIPQISGNTTKKQYITAFKATMNNLQSGIQTFEADNGYDFSGNRTITDGPTVFRQMLEQKLGAQIIKLRTNQQWVAQGIVANSFETIRSYTDPTTDETFDIKTSILFNSSALDNWKLGTANTVQTLAFGTSSDASDYNAPASATNNPASTTTYKLKNGTYILIPPHNNSGCNFNNVRWTGSEYETPNINANSNSDAKINLCLAYIDVNGPKGPNRITNCMSNSVITSPISTTNCENMTAKEVADVFPILYFDDQIIPATAASNTVFSGNIAD